MVATETFQTFDIDRIRQDFPILHQKVHNKQLVYLDNAATSQKPKAVIEALNTYYLENNANIHRGAHYLAAKSTADYEESRELIRDFLKAGSIEEVIFTRGVTEGINLVASTWGRQNIQQGDEIILSTLEHHSNIVPWQILAEEKRAKIKVIPIADNGTLLIEEYKKLLSSRTKLVSIVHASNALGVVNPVKDIISLAHEQGAKVLVDGAQASVHLDIDVQALDCDFYVFSGHKVYAPTGIGALYGKKSLLEAMPPYHGGGEMIKEVSFEKTTYNDLPYKFEAGTPNIADGIAFKKALEYINQFGKESIARHEDKLLNYVTEEIMKIDGVEIYGTTESKVSVLSFNVRDIHHGDLGTLLDSYGIAVRTGHHCTQPLMKRLGVLGTVRASFAMYNTKEDVDIFIEHLKRAVQLLK